MVSCWICNKNFSIFFCCLTSIRPTNPRHAHATINEHIYIHIEYRYMARRDLVSRVPKTIFIRDMFLVYQSDNWTITQMINHQSSRRKILRKREINYYCICGWMAPNRTQYIYMYVFHFIKIEEQQMRKLKYVFRWCWNRETVLEMATQGDVGEWTEWMYEGQLSYLKVDMNRNLFRSRSLHLFIIHNLIVGLMVHLGYIQYFRYKKKSLSLKKNIYTVKWTPHGCGTFDEPVQ